MEKCEQTREVKVHFGYEDEAEKLCSSCYSEMMADHLGMGLKPIIKSVTSKRL